MSSSLSAGVVPLSSGSADTWYLPPSQRPKSISRQRELQKGKSGQADRSGPIISSSQVGQRVLIIASSFRGLGGFLLGFRRLGGGFLGSAVGLVFSFAVGGGLVALGALLLRFGRRLVRLTSIIRLIKAGAFENDGRSGPENSAQLRLAALRTFLQRLVVDRLKLVEVVLTSIAMVFIGGHRFWFLVT